MDDKTKEKVYVFFDEFGNAHLNLEKEGSFSHFIYTGIVISESNLSKARSKRDEISREYFQNTDIRSRNIKNNDKGFNKRMNILGSLKELNFLVFVQVINKGELNSNGLKYKEVFYKFFQKTFIEKLTLHYSAFEIYADELGYPEFKRGLTEFIEENAFQRDLFNQDRYYKLVDDIKEEPLIQLADFLSGCVGKIYCTSHQHDKADLLYDSLKDRLYVDVFPFQKEYFSERLPENHPEKDKQIASISMRLIKNYLDSDRSDNPYHSDEVLKRLLLNFKISPNRLVDTDELVDLINRFDNKYSTQNLRQAIGYLRDKGLLIASIQGRYGYKIPNKIDDLYGFYNRYMNSVVPMLKRINRCNDVLKIESVNDVNILEMNPNFDVLRDLLEAINKKE